MALKIEELMRRIALPKRYWGLFAIDYNEDYDSYENFSNKLIRMEIPFLVSSEAVKYYEFWKNYFTNTDIKYKDVLLAYMNRHYKQIPI